MNALVIDRRYVPHFQIETPVRSPKLDRIITRRPDDKSLPDGRPLLGALLNVARWRLTWFGFKGDRFAADAAALMGVNPQVVLGARHQLGHRDGRLLYHSLNFDRLVALETQEGGQLHWWGCGLLATGQQVEVTDVQLKWDHDNILGNSKH